MTRHRGFKLVSTAAIETTSYLCLFLIKEMGTAACVWVDEQ